MSYILNFGKWKRVNEETVEVPPKQVIVSGTNSVKMGPPKDTFDATPSCGPIKLVVFTEIKKDEAQGFQGSQQKPYVLIWPDGLVEFDGYYFGNRTLQFKPDGSDKYGIYMVKNSGNGFDSRFISSGATSLAEAFKVCFYACRTLYGNEYGSTDEGYAPMTWAVNVKGMLLAMQKIKNEYPTYVAKNKLFNDFYTNLQKAGNFGDVLSFAKALVSAKISGGSSNNDTPSTVHAKNVWAGVRYFQGKTA